MFAPPVTQVATRATAPKAAPARAPDTAAGNQARLRGLTPPPIVQQAEAPNVLRRDIAEADIAATPVSQIMADPNYFENGMAHIEFYGAEMARLIYLDGKQLDLGLVPGQLALSPRLTPVWTRWAAAGPALS